MRLVTHCAPHEPGEVKKFSWPCKLRIETPQRF